MSETVQEKTVVKAKRNTRVKLGSRNKLKYPDKPGFHRRVVNDRDDRIEQFLAAGYVHVKGDEVGGDLSVKDPAKLGKNVSKPVGNGITGYLMEIPQEFYDEDQKEKQEKITRAERAITENKPEGLYGEISIAQ